MGGKELHFGKAPKTAEVKVFNCPSCGAGVQIRAAGQSVVAVCGSCSSIIDASNENFKVIEQAAKLGRRTQLIPLGRRGKLHGAMWEVIGYLERMDGSGLYFWSEYLLFNPFKGFRWLTEADGHWNFIATTKGVPKSENMPRKLANYLGKDYYLFHVGTARVVYVIGEFYWQVKQGETVQVQDYVSPPEILSSEKSDSEVIWSLGEYVPSAQIRVAFQITKPMPGRLGVAPNQPSTVSNAFSEVSKTWAKFLGVIIALQFGHMIFAKNKTVYSGQFAYIPTEVEKTKVSPQFVLGDGLANVEILLSSPVYNNWIEVQGELVNDDNGNTVEFEQGVEFYTGQDHEGHWSEGSQHSSNIISSIPSGKYHLNLEVSNGQISDISYRIVVKRDVVVWSNFLWAVILLSVYPFFLWWIARSFEMSRWSQSDFSPFFAQRE